MSKKFLLALLVVLITIGTFGCSYIRNSNNVSSDRSRMVVSSSSSDSNVLPPSSNESVSSNMFTNEEIESAKKIAEAYYKGTTWKPKSYQFDTTNRLYKQYSSKYEKDKLIVFTVAIENSEDPPRGIALTKADTNSDWKVVDEGY